MIEEMNYEVDMVARSLKNNKTMTIGVILTSISRIFIPQVIGGMQDIATKKGYNLMLYATNDSFEKEKKYVRMLVNSKVDGIIIDSVADKNNKEYYQYLLNLSRGKKEIPVLSLERDLSDYGISSVFVNNEVGGFMATEYLIQSGCTNIVHIGGIQSAEMCIDRLAGYKRALNQYGLKIKEEFLVSGDFSPLSGYRKIKKLLADGIEFDGIFADNDQMAIGAIKTLSESGLKIPSDVKIMGYDNTFISSIVTPSLSTINVPKFRMGVEAVNGICEAIDDIDRKDGNIFCKELPISLLTRQSTDEANVSAWDLEDW